MRRIIIFAVVILYVFASVGNAAAQSTESIWLSADTKSYKTGEIVLVTLNVSSSIPVQGFTFQIRYDPSCLSPVNASSPITGMNGLPLPQLTGLVDGSYASTTSQTVSGVLAEVRFNALKECQTELALESAALAVRSVEGFAVPVPGIAVDVQGIPLFIDKGVGTPQSFPSETGSILPLAPPEVKQAMPEWSVIAVIIVLLLGLSMFGVYKLSRTRKTYKAITTRSSPRRRRNPSLHIKHGPQAGKSFSLNKLPILIGRDQRNDICVNDPYIIDCHVKIYSERNGYYLKDLGGGTFINGRSVKGRSVVLYPGDVVQLGKSLLFVFG